MIRAVANIAAVTRPMPTTDQALGAGTGSMSSLSAVTETEPHAMR